MFSSFFLFRYLVERRLPDSAVDLMDEAASHLRMQLESKPEDILTLERKILTLRIEGEALKKEKDKASNDRLKHVQDELTQLDKEVSVLNTRWSEEKKKRASYQLLKESYEKMKLELEHAIRGGDYNHAGELKHVRLPALEHELATLAPDETNSIMREAVTSEDVAQVVARLTGIPVSRLLTGEREKLLHMEEKLKQKVVGQERAVEAIANCIRIARAGLHAHTKPLGCFLFLGPSGVGKTELAKALAEFLFDDPNAMIRIDMSEYMERHSVSRLIGAPPGYIGYEEGGQLTEAVRRRPYQVVLLDECEKANREVSNVLLQCFDEGHLTDGQGRKVDFRNTIIIMTSNLGAAASYEAGLVDQPVIEQFMMQAVRHHFPPEFVNRLDDIVVFGRLGKEVMPGIVDIQMKDVQRLLRTQQVELRLTPEGKQWLAEKGHDSNYGARPLKRIIYKYVLNPLAMKVLASEVREGSIVEVGIHRETKELELTVVHEGEGEFVKPAEVEPLMEVSEDNTNADEIEQNQTSTKKKTNQA